MMLDGEIAAAILGTICRRIRAYAPRYPNPHAAAQKVVQREGVIPINHMFVVHKDIARKRPDVVRELSRMICREPCARCSGRQRIDTAAGSGGEPQGPGDGDRLVLRAEDHSAHVEADELFDDTTVGLGVWMADSRGRRGCRRSRATGGQILVDALRAQGVDRIYLRARARATSGTGCPT